MKSLLHEFMTGMRGLRVVVPAMSWDNGAVKKKGSAIRIILVSFVCQNARVLCSV